MLIPSFETREITGVHSRFAGHAVSQRADLGQVDDAAMGRGPMPLNPLLSSLENVELAKQARERRH